MISPDLGVAVAVKADTHRIVSGSCRMNSGMLRQPGGNPDPIGDAVSFCSMVTMEISAVPQSREIPSQKPFLGHINEFVDACFALRRAARYGE